MAIEVTKVAKGPLDVAVGLLESAEKSISRLTSDMGVDNGLSQRNIISRLQSIAGKVAFSRQILTGDPRVKLEGKEQSE